LYVSARILGQEHVTVLRGRLACFEYFRYPFVGYPLPKQISHAAHEDIPGLFPLSRLIKPVSVEGRSEEIGVRIAWLFIEFKGGMVVFNITHRSEIA
jgi:hypothetical protein